MKGYKVKDAPNDISTVCLFLNSVVLPYKKELHYQVWSQSAQGLQT